MLYIYAVWRTMQTWAILRDRLSAQHQKAWLASFPTPLWPAEEEETEDGRIFLRLKDGTRLWRSSPAGRNDPITPQEPTSPEVVANIGKCWFIRPEDYGTVGRGHASTFRDLDFDSCCPRRRRELIFTASTAIGMFDEGSRSIQEGSRSIQPSQRPELSAILRPT